MARWRRARLSSGPHASRAASSRPWRSSGRGRSASASTASREPAAPAVRCRRQFTGGDRKYRGSTLNRPASSVASSTNRGTWDTLQLILSGRHGERKRTALDSDCVCGISIALTRKIGRPVRIAARPSRQLLNVGNKTGRRPVHEPLKCRHITIVTAAAAVGSSLRPRARQPEACMPGHVRRTDLSLEEE